MSDEPTFEEHMDRLGGELDTLALLQDLYDRDDVSISWTTYVNPEPPEGLNEKTVLDTFEEYREDVSDDGLDELEAAIEDERKRRDDGDETLLTAVWEALKDLLEAPEDDSEGNEQATLGGDSDETESGLGLEIDERPVEEAELGRDE